MSKEAIAVVTICSLIGPFVFRSIARRVFRFRPVPTGTIVDIFDTVKYESRGPLRNPYWADRIALVVGFFSTLALAHIVARAM